MIEVYGNDVLYLMCFENSYLSLGDVNMKIESDVFVYVGSKVVSEEICELVEMRKIYLV